MELPDVFVRIWHHLLGRESGPFHLRLILQPAMATFFAIRDGLRDARTGRTPYFETICMDPGQRADLLRAGWKSVRSIFVAAIVIDIAYSLIRFHHIYPLETLIVACTLALIPYLITRGPTNRIMRRRAGNQASTRDGRQSKVA